MTKICIYGAGAIGGHIAGHLARAGLCDVSVVARGKALAALHRDGLTVETPEGRFTTHPRATDDPATLGPQDYVLLTLKGHQLDAALPAVAPLIGPATTILPPTTGLPAAFLHALDGPFRDRPLPPIDPQGIQARAIPPGQVLGIVYWIGAHTVAPAFVHQDGPRATCMVGELDGTSSARAVRLSEILSASGIPTPVRPNIRGDIWIKFVNSLCWNPAAVLTLATNGAIGGDPAAIATVRRMMEEADAVAARLGLLITVPPEKRIAVTLSAPGHKMSMLQDFEAGRLLELETLERSIRAAKDLADLPTPTIDAALALASLRARTPSEETIA
jgi:2-dehydropantoate 2-reductase